MKRQQGQSMVEFALIAPIVFLMIFGMIWGGIMFMEYMHYSNAVRTAARQIAVMTDDNEREQMKKNQATWLTNLWQKEVKIKLYEPTTTIIIENTKDEDGNDLLDDKGKPLSREVKVTVTFVRQGTLPVILEMVDFPPRYIKGLTYRMRVEEVTSDTSTSTTDTSTTEDTDTGNTGGGSLVDSTSQAVSEGTNGRG